MKIPDISVIMRSNNDAGTIGETLKMLYAQTAQDFELINMDNASIDGTIDIIKRYNRPGKIFNVEKGRYMPGRVLNEAVAIARGRIIVFLNSDATPANEKWLEYLIGGLNKEMKVMAVYGRQIARKNAVLLVRMDYERCYPPAGKDSLLTEPMFSFASAAMYKKIWEEQRFYEGGLAEDIEWSHRITARGYRYLYVPQSEVFHSHRYPLKMLFKKTYLEHIPIGALNKGRNNFLIQLKRCVAAIRRDMAACLKNADFRALLYSPLYRIIIFMSSYLGMKKGMRVDVNRK